MQDMDVKVISTMRALAADAIQKANSGHPGTPLGASPMAYTLWAKQMNHNPADPKWRNRDRFVLSAGHASAMLYSLLHLFGYGLTMDDLKNFRQLDSKTPGHPEYGHTVGVETTTGPLGQGVANAVGMAMAEKHLAAKFNRPGFPVVDHYTYALMGDGCVMEGISGEASALAGDAGPGQADRCSMTPTTSPSRARWSWRCAKTYPPSATESYGWHVQKVADGEDIDAIGAAIEAAKQGSPPLADRLPPPRSAAHCPAKEGKDSAHGEPLGVDNVRALKENLGMDPDRVLLCRCPPVYEETAKVAAKGAEKEAEWNKMMEEYAKAYPELAAGMGAVWFARASVSTSRTTRPSGQFEGKEARPATPAASVLSNSLPSACPNLFGGSADLAPSNKTYHEGRAATSPPRLPRAATCTSASASTLWPPSCNGMQLHGGLQTYAATFFVFSDYMKNGMRMSALMKPARALRPDARLDRRRRGRPHPPAHRAAGRRCAPCPACSPLPSR